jgi:putative tricarboxylic transport membrane protein
MNKEGVSAPIFLLAGIYGLVFSIQLPMGRWNEPGPGVFPLCLSFLLCLSGALGFIYRKRKGEGEPGTDWRRVAKNLVTPLRIIAVIAAFIVCLDKLGYLVVSTLFMLVLFLWVSRYKLWFAITLSIVLGIGGWLFFVRLLSVQLPPGVLGL